MQFKYRTAVKVDKNVFENSSHDIYNEIITEVTEIERKNVLRRTIRCKSNDTSRIAVSSLDFYHSVIDPTVWNNDTYRKDASTNVTLRRFQNPIVNILNYMLREFYNNDVSENINGFFSLNWIFSKKEN